MTICDRGFSTLQRPVLLAEYQITKKKLQEKKEQERRQQQQSTNSSDNKFGFSRDSSTPSEAWGSTSTINWNTAGDTASSPSRGARGGHSSNYEQTQSDSARDSNSWSRSATAWTSSPATEQGNKTQTDWGSSNNAWDQQWPKSGAVAEDNWGSKKGEGLGWGGAREK